MRWHTPIPGEHRTVWRFLYLPVRLPNVTKEYFVTRWLEWALINQTRYDGWWESDCWDDA